MGGDDDIDDLDLMPSLADAEFNAAMSALPAAERLRWRAIIDADEAKQVRWAVCLCGLCGSFMLFRRNISIPFFLPYFSSLPSFCRPGNVCTEGLRRNRTLHINPNCGDDMQTCKVRLSWILADRTFQLHNFPDDFLRTREVKNVDATHRQCQTEPLAMTPVLMHDA